MVRVVDGRVRVGDKIRFMATARGEYEVTRLGNFTPFHHEKEVLLSGEVGFICASIKNDRAYQNRGYRHLARPALANPFAGLRGSQTHGFQWKFIPWKAMSTRS